MDDLTLSQKLFGGSSTKNDVSAATTSGASVVYMIAVTSSSGGEVVLKPEVEDDWDYLEEGTDYIVVDEDGEFDDEDEEDSIEYDDGSVLDLTDGDGVDIEGIEADTYTVAAYQAEAVALAAEAEPDAEVDPQPDGTMDSAIDDGDAEDTDSTETAEVDSMPSDSDTLVESEADFTEDDDEDPCIMDYGDTVEGAEVSDGYTVASTIGSVNEGDRVAVMIQDGQLTVIGVVGSGDVQQAENAIAQEAADEALKAASEAKEAAYIADAKADSAKNLAEAASNNASIAITKAEYASESAIKASTEANEAKDALHPILDEFDEVADNAKKAAAANAETRDLMESSYAKKTDLTTTEAQLKTYVEQSAAAYSINAGMKASGVADGDNASSALKTASAALDSAKADVETAQESLDSANSVAAQATSNLADAQEAYSEAVAAKNAAVTSLNKAKTALAKAQELGDQTAIDEAQAEVDSCEIRLSNANTALQAATDNVTSMKSALNTANANVETAKASVKSAQAAYETAANGFMKEYSACFSVSPDSVSIAVSKAVENIEATLEGYPTISNMNSAIEQKADSITQTVSETYQPKGDYVTGTSAYSQLTQTVNGLDSTVQSHSGSISNLQHTADGIKVRLENQQTVKNLVSKSRRLDGWGHVVSNGVTISKNVSTDTPELGEVTVARFNASSANSSAQSSYIHMTNAARVTSGKKYTFSMWARKVSGGNARPLFSISSTNSQSAVIPENLTTEWKRYSYTFTLGTIVTSGNRSDITTSFGINVLANQTGVFEICCPQLEAGDTMNPWSANSVDATDYMSFTQEGLVIGDMTKDGLGNNVLIDSDSVDLRTGSYVCGSFSLNDGYAAHASAVECIAMTSGSSLKWPNMCPWKVTLDKSGLNPGDVIKIAGTWTKSINGQVRYSLTLDHYAVIGEAVSGDTITIGAIGDFATDGFVCLSSAGNGNYYPLIPGDVSDSRMETDEVKAMGNKSLSLSSGDRTSSIVLGNGFDISSSDALNALVSNFRIDASGDKSEVISPDVVELTHSTSGNSIGVGVGSGGVNRGIYDYVFDKWVLYCDSTDLYIASSRGGAFKPYYTAGDTISLDRLNTAGFVTSSKTKVYFSFNPGKPLYGVSSISCSSIDGLALRQNDAYTHGSSSSSLVKPSSYLASAVGNSIGICATFTKTTNAVNNAPIGVAASIKITFA